MLIRETSSVTICRLGEGIVCDSPEVFKPAIIFLHAPRAVIATNGIGWAIPAAKRGGFLNMAEIAVFTESPAVEAGSSADIHVQLRHSLYIGIDPD